VEAFDSSDNVGAWLRCYRCWSRSLEVQLHVEGIYKIDPDTAERTETVDELHEAVIQCVDCLHDQPHLTLLDGRIAPVEDRWERMVTGTPWVASALAPRPQNRSLTQLSENPASASFSPTCVFTSTKTGRS
jgi:hypothetical protein